MSPKQQISTHFCSQSLSSGSINKRLLNGKTQELGFKVDKSTVFKLFKVFCKSLTKEKKFFVDITNNGDNKKVSSWSL